MLYVMTTARKSVLLTTEIEWCGNGYQGTNSVDKGPVEVSPSSEMPEYMVSSLIDGWMDLQ
jgi:hypothetical protein